MVLCGILTLVLVPATLPRRSRARAARTPDLSSLASWVALRRTPILGTAALATVLLGAAAAGIRINPTLDRLRSVTPGAAAMERIGREFGLGQDVYAIIQRGPVLDDLAAADERLAEQISQALPHMRAQRASALLPSRAVQQKRAAAIAGAVGTPAEVTALLEREAATEGFRPHSFAPFEERLPRLLARAQDVTFEGYVEHGLGDVIGRFVARMPDGWLLATYVFPPDDAGVARLEELVAASRTGATLTGLPLVNRELAERFMPQFSRGLAIGTALVLVLIVAALRDWRLSLLSLLPTVVGLIWAAGILSLARVELDLFAVFAVATFVGIGVDYGIHLVHRFRERGDASLAIAELAPVILIAAAITLLGYGTLILSSYPPLRSIGLVSVVAVVTLALASVFVLPALLTPAKRARS
jgi:hypothetical protein